MNGMLLSLKLIIKTKILKNLLKTSMVLENVYFYRNIFIHLIFVVNDLEIDFIKLVTDPSKYFGDILSRMLPPDFSNLNQLIYAMFETIEIAFLGTFIAILLSIPLGLFSARNLAPNYFVYLVCKT